MIAPDAYEFPLSSAATAIIRQQILLCCPSSWCALIKQSRPASCRTPSPHVT